MELTLSEYGDMLKNCERAGVFVECCGEYCDMTHIEPLEGRNTLQVERTCILICHTCNKRYVSRYD